MSSISRNYSRRIIPGLLIVFISFSGFIAGYLQNRFNVDYEENFTQAQIHEEIADNIFDTMQYLIDIDIEYQRKADDLNSEIYILIQEWRSLLNPMLNISEEQISIINNTHLISIQVKLFQAGWNINSTLAHQLFEYFEFYQNEDPFIIATQDIDGFDYNISKNLWENVNLGEEIAMLNFLNESLIDSGIGNDTDILDRILSDSPQNVFQFNIEQLRAILMDSYLTERFQANELYQQANDNQSLINRIALGVSMTTVSAVLANAMANRIEERQYYHSLHDVKKYLDNKYAEIKPPKDIISLPIMIIALIIALGGLFYAIFM